ALELASEFLEDGARPRIGEQVAEQLVLAMREHARRAGSRSVIVLPPPRRTDQHGIRLTDLPETLGPARVARPPVGMHPGGLPPVGSADLILGGLPGDTEDRIVVLVETCSGHRVSLRRTGSAHHTAHGGILRGWASPRRRPAAQA